MMMCEKPEVMYKLIREMISRDDNLLNITWLCEIAGVSRSGFYRWVKAEPDRYAQELKDRSDFQLILGAYRHRGFAKGARGIYMTLLHQKPAVVMNIKKIRRLMSKYHLSCPIRRKNPYRQALRDMYSGKIAENVVNREFFSHGPRKVLLTDITYIPRTGGDFTYLSTIIDAFTMEILAFALSDSMRVDFVLETVQSLIANHGISLTAETLVHSDQGSHYTSYAFINILKDNDLRQSMSRRANCWDNAPQESLFGHMKDDIDISWCTTHEEICHVIEDWIDYYNHERYQWELAKLSPCEFYEYISTGVYPLGGAAPEPPEFIALISGKGGVRPRHSLKEKDEAETPPSPQT